MWNGAAAPGVRPSADIQTIASMPDLPPRDPWPDATLPLLRDPYRYASRRARALGAEAFRTRLTGRRAIVLTGVPAAEYFYARAPATRDGATPARIARVLFGLDGIQALDGVPHAARKAMWLSLMDKPAEAALVARVEAEWRGRVPAWRGGIDLFEETSIILGRAVCAWAGIDGGAEPGARLRGLFLRAGNVGPSHLRGRIERARAEAWARDWIRSVRHAPGAHDPRAPAVRIALWERRRGGPLPLETATDDLLSLLRPVVAVAVFVVFLAHALAIHPEVRARAAISGADGRAERHRLVQEVRRLYPFFPMVGAITTDTSEFGGFRIPEGVRLILDIHGTNRDPRAWEVPDAFRPDRFDGREVGPYEMIPQGGGLHARTHRCAGEWATIALMELFADVLTRRSDWTVEGRLRDPDMRAIPALPKGGLRLSGLRLR